MSSSAKKRQPKKKRSASVTRTAKSTRKPASKKASKKPAARKRRSSSSKKKAPPVTTTQGWRVIRWIETHCVHAKGQWIGRPFSLLLWQKKLILDLFETEASGLRRFRWALVGVPKKNGKTELAAALALYFLLGDDEPAPEVVCAAASDDQADLVFGAAKTMCELSKTLSRVTEVFDKEILVPSIPGAKLRRVAAVAGANDGQNIHVVILDELHEWRPGKGEAVWNVLTGGSGSRRQPLVLQITTAGYDLQTVCGREYEYGKKVVAGQLDDRAFFYYWCEAPADADYRKPATWAACNPSFGVTVHEDYLRSQLKKKPENIFRRYYLNQWTSAEDAWLPTGAWDKCFEEGAEIPDGAAAVLGVDVGLKKDTAAIVALWEREDGRIVWEVVDVFEPRPDEPVELASIEQAIRDVGYRLDVQFVLFDPWRFQRSAEILGDEGFMMVEFPMTNERTVTATDRAYKAIVEKRIVHNGNPTLKAHVEAGALKDTERGPRLAKAKSKKPVDSLIAGVIALPTIDQVVDEIGVDFG